MAYVSIGKGHKLEPTTARQFMLMNDAFHRQFGEDIRVTWSTRDSAEQIRLLNKYYNRTNKRTGKFWDGSYWVKKPGSNVTVATPGTSRHERGFALDVWSFEWANNSAMAAWARANAAKYGFAFNVAGEPWHIDRVLGMQITSGRQRPLGSAESYNPGQMNEGGSGPAPAPVKKEDEDMKDYLLLVQTPQKGAPSASDWWVQNLWDHTYYHVKSEAQLKYLRALGVKEVGGQQQLAVLDGFKLV